MGASLIAKRTCQKNELRHFRWNLGAVSFPPNSWPAAELPREKNVDCELQSALASFPDPRGFLRVPHSFLREPRFSWGTSDSPVVIFYSSRGVLLSIFFQLSFLHHTLDFLLCGIRFSPNFTFQTHFTISFCLLSQYESFSCFSSCLSRKWVHHQSQIVMNVRIAFLSCLAIALHCIGLHPEAHKFPV